MVGSCPCGKLGICGSVDTRDNAYKVDAVGREVAGGVCGHNGYVSQRVCTDESTKLTRDEVRAA